MCAGMGPGWTASASFWLMISEIVREEEELKHTSAGSLDGISLNSYYLEARGQGFRVGGV